MVKEGILTCEFLPLKPYTGYASLFAQQPNIPSTGAGTTDVAVN
jgi:hypothetical protein